ncbi:MAG: hypothetical protein CVV21_01475 [Candidatus Goldiibacteriota bacterium HGW-Goldbacteria-1]|jgi:hypothetical protein|nr:MAG: hypothetical protein CVV21_01475 [Candidatus Goldiibacteriota bacterium HGW-Goldbacteria-1]
MKLIKEYSYGQNAGTMIMIAVLLFGFAAGAAWLGYTVKSELVIRVVIKLSPSQARVLYYTAASVCGLFALLSLISAKAGMDEKKKLIVYDDRIIISGITKPVSMFFREMVSVNERKVSSTRFIDIDMEDGYKALISNVNFKNTAEFEDAIELIKTTYRNTVKKSLPPTF